MITIEVTCSLFIILSLHDALPISYGRGWNGETLFGTNGRLARPKSRGKFFGAAGDAGAEKLGAKFRGAPFKRSEEHTSELQSHVKLVCRLLPEKKKRIIVYQ